MHLLLQVVQRIDLNIYQYLSHFAGNWTIDHIMSLAEENNFLKGGVFFFAYWYLWFRPSPDLDRRRRQILAILTSALLALGTSRALALAAPFRIRPIHDPALPHVAFSMQWAANMEDWSSFPSDHAACFFALAFGLAYLVRKLAAPVMLYTAAWICLPRMYLGIHYASDIVGGAIIGMAAAAVTLHSSWLLSFLGRRVLSLERARPAWFYAAAFLVSYEMTSLFDDLRSIGHAVMHGMSRDAGHSVGHGVGEFALLTLAGIALAVSILWLARLRRRPAAGRRVHPQPIWR